MSHSTDFSTPIQAIDKMLDYINDWMAIVEIESPP